MGGFKDLFLSERGIVTILLLIAATVFVCIGVIDFPQWQTYTMTVSAVYVGSKTVTGVAAIIKGPQATDDPPSKPAPAPTPAPAPAPAPIIVAAA